MVKNFETLGLLIVYIVHKLCARWPQLAVLEIAIINLCNTWAVHNHPFKSQYKSPFLL